MDTAFNTVGVNTVPVATDMAGAKLLSKMPVLEASGANYEGWKRDVELWCLIADGTEMKKAIMVYLSLTGRPKLVTEEIGEQLRGQGVLDKPVKMILEKLDKVFLPEKGMRQFNAFNNLYCLRRKDGGDVNEFVAEFEHTMIRFKQEGMDLPDSVTAFMLLGACNLKVQESHLVMTAVSAVTYEEVKAAVSRIFGHKIAQMHPAGVNHEVKSEPVWAENTRDGGEETLYTRGRGTGRRGGRMGGVSVRGGATGWSQQVGDRQYQNRRRNPMGPDGRVSVCVICESTMHWARDCPHSYERAGRRHYEKDEQKTQSKGNFMGFFNDFVGCTVEEGKQEGGDKLKALLEGTQGGAVMDTACVNSVCGEEGLGRYLADMSEAERALVKEEPGVRTFVFGDGISFKSRQKVMIPCCIGGMQGILPVDVVECGIPMLLGLQSMRKLGMELSFGRDQMMFKGRRIKLDVLNSGHYFLPLSE